MVCLLYLDVCFPGDWGTDPNMLIHGGRYHQNGVSGVSLKIVSRLQDDKAALQ